MPCFCTVILSHSGPSIFQNAQACVSYGMTLTPPPPLLLQLWSLDLQVPQPPLTGTSPQLPLSARYPSPSRWSYNSPVVCVPTWPEQDNCTSCVTTSFPISLATGINQTLVTQPIDSPLDLQFPILLAYSDIIVALTDGSDLSVSLTLVTPHPYVVIGGWSPFSSTQLIGASNEGKGGLSAG